jgi:hypothetical protein
VSMERISIYYLVFETAAAALSFQAAATAAFSSPVRSEWPKVGFPPGSKPEFAVLDLRRSQMEVHGVRSALEVGGSAPGRCVLLNICGAGGKRRVTGKLPRTSEIRDMLEERDIRLCRRDVEEGNVGVQRLVFERAGSVGKRVIKADGRGFGAEGRWLIRCESESEAHRVVRELHGRSPWENCGVFQAEVVF